MVLYRPRWSAIYSPRVGAGSFRVDSTTARPERRTTQPLPSLLRSHPRAASLLIHAARQKAAVHPSSGARQRREVKPRMLVNKFARIEEVPLSELPYWDWLLYPSAYPRWNPWRK